MNLRDYQRLAVEDAVAFLATAPPGGRRLYAAPTGSGKGVIERAVLSAVPGAWLVTPRVEILAGMVAGYGRPVPDGLPALIAAAEELRITTPMRLRGRMLKGGESPAAYILDEAHHDAASTWQDLHTLAGHVPAVGYTATPYRGTPQGTAALRRDWGDPVWIITFREAVSRGDITMPLMSIVPLVDDDEISVERGELVASEVTSATVSRLGDAVLMAGHFYTTFWDTPTVFSVPSVEIAEELTERLRAAGAPAACVTGKTKHADRQEAFAACIDRRVAIVQVNVVSEGVDLPLRRLIDLSPTLSPVKWVQQLGRITRPGGVSHYLCTNRNLLRHAYALAGAVPSSVLRAAQDAFPPSARSASRSLGLEALGRLKATPVPLLGGLIATAFCVSAVEGAEVVDYCAIAHPAKEEVFWAMRVSDHRPGEPRAWGRWRRCAPPENLDGYASIPPGKISEKQAAWWERAARRHGLDGEAEVNARAFQVLPVLADTGGRL